MTAIYAYLSHSDGNSLDAGYDHFAGLGVECRCHLRGSVLCLAVTSPGESEYRVTHLDMLFEILRTFEGLAAEVALVGFQGNVDANV